MALLVGGFGLQFAVTNPLLASRVFHLGSVGFGLFGTSMAVGGIAGTYNAGFIGFGPAGTFAVAAIAATAGIRWALIAPGLAVVAGAIALAARTRAAVRTEAAAHAADAAIATHGSGLP
jgi:hypothetical protein